jgi:hypothetical protein
LLTDTAGLAPVWVPIKKYDMVAREFAKTADGKYAKKLLLQRLAPLRLDSDCTGSCGSGKSCQWILLESNGAKLYVCGCS